MTYSAWYHWIFSAALATMAYGFALSGGSLSLLVLAQGLVLLIAVSGFLFSGYSCLRRRNIMMLCALSVVMISSILFNTGNYSETSVPLEFALAHTAGIIGILFALQWAATNLATQTLLRNLAMLLMPLIILAIAASMQSGDFSVRQTPFDIHPNWWGELSFALTACALALPHWKARAFPLALAILLFFLVQSRGALLAAVGCIGIYVFLSIRWKRLLNSLRLALASALLVALAVGLFVYQYRAIQAWLFLRDEVLLWDNPYRGADSGLTGRLSGWREAADIFMAQPVLGQGIDTLTNVHNGFLRLAGEGGMMLLLVVGLLVGVGLRDALKARNHLTVSIILGYLIYAMTYPRMLNMNLAAIVFYLSLFSGKMHYKVPKPPGEKPRRIVRRSSLQPTPLAGLEVER